MTKQEYFKLLDQLEAELATKEQERLLNAYYNLFNLRNDGLQHLDDIEVNQLQRDIRKGITRRIGRKISLWPGVAVAASILLVFGAGFYYFNTTRSAGDNQFGIAGQHDIAPGKNTATLTLANGEVINLSDAKTGFIVNGTANNSELTYSDGTTIATAPAELGSVSRSASRNDEAKALLTATTPRGGTYQVILPDGTKVWLNAASSIQFPSTFAGLNQRVIQLTGEAYFEVSKNKKMPFVVKTANQEVTVLGTHFNINSYTDEPVTKTTLLEGLVKVSSLQGSKTNQSILAPGQQAVLNRGSLKVHRIDVEDAIAWKNGKFLFAMEDIRGIMRKVSRWYDVDVAYEGNIDDKTIGGSVSRYKNVSEVLNMLSATKTVRFKIKGRRIIVMPYEN